MTYLPIAAAVLVAAGIGFTVWRAYYSQPDLNRGLVALNTAYRQERPVAARLTDLDHAPLRNTRGESSKVDELQRELAESSLLKAAADHPNDAASRHLLGEFYVTNREFDKAIRELNAALALDPNNAKIHSDLGAALLELGKLQRSGSESGKEFDSFSRSLRHLQKAIELNSSQLEAYFNRALVLENMWPADQAAAAWKEYLERDATSPWADEARGRLKEIEAQGGARSGVLSDAVNNFLQAVTEGDDDAAWRLIVQNYTSAGNAITNYLLDTQLGIERADLVSAAATDLSSLETIARLEMGRANDRYTLDLVGQLSRAPPHARIALRESRRHMRTAYALFTESNYKDAINEYDKAKQAYELANAKSGVALVEYRLAHCYVFLPDLDRARFAFNRLLSLYESHQYRWLLAQSYVGLAHASADSSEYSKAFEYSQQALDQFEQIGDTNGIVKSLTQFGDYNQALNRLNPSLSYLSKALEVASTARVEPIQRWTLLTLIGFSMSSMELYEAAMFYHKEALATALKMNRPLPISRSHSYVGSVYAMMRKFNEAVKEATNAFAVGQERQGTTGGLEIMANASLQLGEIRRQARDCSRALEHYDKSIELYSQLKFNYYSYNAHKGRLLCFIANNSQRAAIGNELRKVMGLSSEYRSKLTTDSDRNNFFDMEQGVYDLAIAHETAANEKVKAFHYSEESKGRSLLDAVQQGAAVTNRGVEPELNLQAATRSLSVDEIRSKMPPATQILHFAVLDEGVVIWLVTQSGLEYTQVPVAASSLNDKVKALLEVVTQPTGAFDANLAAELYRLLIEPAEQRLHLDKHKPLCIVPDKILNHLPFAALVSPRTGKFLVEDYQRLCFAPSSSLFVYLSQAAARKTDNREEKLISVGDPNFSQVRFDSLRDLPASAREARAVAEPYTNPKLLIANQARESSIRAALETADVGHFAMHYILNEQSEMLSGFPLTPEPVHSGSDSLDGFLQSYEIYRLNLRQLRLMVLSACSTGIERQYLGEGSVGAVRPFLVRGVPTVVASLWPVDSDASADLMSDFHKYRRRNSQSVTQALKSAQMEMLQHSDTRFHHPYYWAPFVVIGGLSSY